MPELAERIMGLFHEQEFLEVLEKMALVTGTLLRGLHPQEEKRFPRKEVAKFFTKRFNNAYFNDSPSVPK